VPYLVPSGEWYQLTVDAELQRLGIANHDAAMLEAAITMLREDATRAIGQRLLTRYTNESFETAERWRSWLVENREDLFFSDAAGYRWLVNRRGPAPEISGEDVGTDGDPISVTVRVEPLGRTQKILLVDFHIRDGWHAYLDPPADTPYVGLKIELDLPKGVTPVGDWAVTEFHIDHDDPRLMLLQGRFSMQRLLNLEPTASGDAALTVRYQLCDASVCLPSTEKERTVTLRSSGRRR
jgi:hypothetical protein